VSVIAVVGPTASGKSDLALNLAERLGGEIVNADAMQLYRGMDIGTAKVPVGERRGIAHHQLDVLDVREEASVAAYQREARLDLAGIRSRRHRSILVGGSGLYLRAVLDRLEIPPTDPAVRARLQGELAQEGIEVLHAEADARETELTQCRELIARHEAGIGFDRTFGARVDVKRLLQHANQTFQLRFVEEVRRAAAPVHFGDAWAAADRFAEESELPLESIQISIHHGVAFRDRRITTAVEAARGAKR